MPTGRGRVEYFNIYTVNQSRSRLIYIPKKMIFSSPRPPRLVLRVNICFVYSDYLNMRAVTRDQISPRRCTLISQGVIDIIYILNNPASRSSYGLFRHANLLCCAGLCIRAPPPLFMLCMCLYVTEREKESLQNAINNKLEWCKFT